MMSLAVVARAFDPSTQEAAGESLEFKAAQVNRVSFRIARLHRETLCPNKQTNYMMGWVWWSTPLIFSLGSLRQADL